MSGSSKSSQPGKLRQGPALNRMPFALLSLLQPISEAIRGTREGKRYRTCGAIRTTPASDRANYRAVKLGDAARMGPGC